MAIAKPPNILITGTPGTGKSTTSELIAEASSFRHINVGDWVKEHSLHSGWDTEHESFTIDEDKVRKAAAARNLPPQRHFWPQSSITLLRIQVCDALEDLLSQGGNIVDYHGCDFFPERCAGCNGSH